MKSPVRLSRLASSWARRPSRMFWIEHRDVAGEDRQQLDVVPAELGGALAVDQLEHAADLLLDADRHRHQRLAVVFDQLVDPGEEVAVFAGVRGVVGLAGGVDVAGDAARRGDLAADQGLGLVAEGGDEGQQVVPAVVFLVERVVEQDRARSRGHELVGLARGSPPGCRPGSSRMRKRALRAFVRERRPSAAARGSGCRPSRCFSDGFERRSGKGSRQQDIEEESRRFLPETVGLPSSNS